MDFPNQINRRTFMKITAMATAGAASIMRSRPAIAQDKGERPTQDAAVTVLNPQNRVPLSFIIDDSTCLVNMAHFGIPHFATAWPERYKQDWRKLPREIPDSFVRKFGQWCHEHNVKGKYSIVPYPACVGWLDRCLPGWSQKELDDSLKLVRELMLPDWDIHPEMISHTWVINTKTGRPYPEHTGYYIENAGWSQDKSADQLADYMAYALKILKNVGLPCEGITTPGGFGSQNRDNLAKATLQSCRDVFNAEIPHYFRDLFTDERSVAPLVQYASGLDGDNPKCVVSIIGCTGDWFGGWDGLNPGSADKCITEDLKGGRLPQVIDKGEPAILVCHWPGQYFNGEEIGFNIFKEVVKRIHSRYDNLLWMKQSEIARYWAAKELTKIEKQGGRITFNAPFATTRFTVRTRTNSTTPPKLMANRQPIQLRRVNRPLQLQSQTWHADGRDVTVCFDLPKGSSTLDV
ncbi:MAG: twin-arginine translocation signal domain-containing protein [Sedimentisphaerales bacterium]|nr:twin-arginine translocation signal domain-containing protein [Sedimentisphaerales bacterium]